MGRAQHQSNRSQGYWKWTISSQKSSCWWVKPFRTSSLKLCDSSHTSTILHFTIQLAQSFAVLLALHLTVSVIMVDLDIVFLQKPFPYLYYRDWDFIFQMSRPHINKINTGKNKNYALSIFFLRMWQFHLTLTCIHEHRLLCGSSNHRCKEITNGCTEWQKLFCWRVSCKENQQKLVVWYVQGLHIYS